MRTTGTWGKKKRRGKTKEKDETEDWKGMVSVKQRLMGGNREEEEEGEK